jgi:hypothetical protein
MCLLCRGFFGPLPCQNARRLQNSLLFSLLAGNLGLETGFARLASATKQINILAGARVEHSDNSPPAHSDKLPLFVLSFSLFRAAILRCVSVSLAYRSRAAVLL